MTVELTPARLRAFIREIAKPAGEYGCWTWTGKPNKDGYASSIGYGCPVHRVAYEWMVGPIPEGMQIDHLCRNRACVNPHHLEPVTQAENVRRGRRYGPYPFRRYCRQGHALVGSSVPDTTLVVPREIPEMPRRMAKFV